MKRILLFFLVLCLCLSFTACNSETKDFSMYIEPAQLTTEEENIADLLGMNTNHFIFDFIVDETIQSLQVNTYKLSNGDWKLIAGGGGQAFTDTEGRIALGFERFADGVRVAVQSENVGGCTSYASMPGNNFDSMGCATSILSDNTEIMYEQEIPLAVQIMTAKNQISSYVVEYFNNPKVYAEYEHVYAITVRFSQKTVSELSMEF